jgi:hypothetical protein
MAKDDYFVIAYRLLKYLYDCLKKGKPPDMKTIGADFFEIEAAYWEYILRHLYLDSYLEGVTLFSVAGRSAPVVKISHNFGITPKGIQYLEENSLFQKIKSAVKDIAEILPI